MVGGASHRPHASSATTNRTEERPSPTPKNDDGDMMSIMPTRLSRALVMERNAFGVDFIAYARPGE